MAKQATQSTQTSRKCTNASAGSLLQLPQHRHPLLAELRFNTDTAVCESGW
jgi:hypothetical protein